MSTCAFQSLPLSFITFIITLIIQLPAVCSLLYICLYTNKLCQEMNDFRHTHERMLITHERLKSETKKMVRFDLQLHLPTTLLKY